MNNFENMFSPLQIGSVSLPNRIFMSAGNTKYFSGVAAPNDRAINFWKARAAGGVGLIITGQHHPFPLTTASPPSAYESDDIIPALKRVSDAIHKHGTKCFGQINHPGASFTARLAGGGATWSVKSPVYRQNSVNPSGQDVGHEMNADDIKRAVKSYAATALRFKQAGYDGVEIRAVLGFFQAQFISNVMNLRGDEYGGKLENRIRFLYETLAAVREAVGPDFVVGTRFTADEFWDRMWWSNKKGNTIEQGKEIAKILAESGNLDYLFPCAGSVFYPTHVPSMYYPLGAFVYLASEIKQVVDLPVFTIGRINDPVRAEEILASGQADMVGMFRGLVADPELVNKARTGKSEELRRCIGCCEGCTTHSGLSLPLSCTINVQAGREKEFVIHPAENKKKVLVIGGGGAGLETARIAAVRGHQVSLYEKEDTLARALKTAARAPGREGWEDVIRYYAQQMNRLKVDVHLNAFITPQVVEEMIQKEGYGVVVVATGSEPFIPEISGMNDTELTVVEARKVLNGTASTGEQVLLVAHENHSVALTTADFLAERDKTVEVITESLYAGPQLDVSTSETIHTRLLMKGVTITPLTGLKEIRGKNPIVYNVLTGAERQVENVDTIVIAAESRPNDLLFRALKGKVEALYMVGQCVSPRRLLDSIFDGARVGNSL